ncbi:xylose isomerase [Streptomyces noursei ZPM]|uniref:Xylose isomerase n=1 Tax=Streptomyces noursei TaxID=1971 RepID=A0A401R115_STRNR|nr:sugar phosphate isomerase/epimerase family protein [Streptomyces noursei]AKA03994.1 xylose isomerase [Streptomyces noursei ZPM]EOT06092.1 xylose isomerase [Streptomyces noursei CCRC 11814]EXU88376.1 sugar phosphate isomerase [Streptomyces noursei PD-1]UWS72387.1 sugar phosphate isomerase/epimerase [Streptomyces noursei]GCB91306.1 xylose isomerase [Streptomyces noursei]
MTDTAAPLLSRLSLNQETVRQWSLPELADGCARAGLRGVGLWRAPVRAYGVAAAARLVRDAGLAVTSLCRGGFFTAEDPGERRAALADNRAAIDEAAALGTTTLVLVSGGLPPGSRDLPGARERVADALAELAPYAAERGVRLALEPLHPMYAADRCVVSTLAQALDLAERFPADRVGVVVDTYHLWWDDTVGAQLARAGAAGTATATGAAGPPSRIAAFQLADWVTPLPEGVLLGRGQLGDGAVDLRWFRERVDAAGYRGPVEVEIFNPSLWSRDGAEVLAEVLARFVRHVV